MTSDPEWSPCEPGTLDSFTKIPQSKPALRTRRGALAAVVTIAAGGGLSLLRGEGPGGISCVRVTELASDYVTGGLAADQAKKINAHRRECTRCNSMLEQLEQQKAQRV